jgi:hypothetical protein
MKITKIIKWGSLILLSSVVLVWADCQAECLREFRQRSMDCIDLGNLFVTAACEVAATLAYGICRALC